MHLVLQCPPWSDRRKRCGEVKDSATRNFRLGLWEARSGPVKTQSPASYGLEGGKEAQCPATSALF